MTIEEMLERAMAAEGITFSSAADWPAWTDEVVFEPTPRVLPMPFCCVCGARSAADGFCEFCPDWGAT